MIYFLSHVSFFLWQLHWTAIPILEVTFNLQTSVCRGFGLKAGHVLMLQSVDGFGVFAVQRQEPWLVQSVNACQLVRFMCIRYFFRSRYWALKVVIVTPRNWIVAAAAAWLILRFLNSGKAVSSLAIWCRHGLVLIKPTLISTLNAVEVFHCLVWLFHVVTWCWWRGDLVLLPQWLGPAIVIDSLHHHLVLHKLRGIAVEVLTVFKTVKERNRIFFLGYGCSHVAELLSKLLQHAFAHLELDGSGMVLYSEGILA